MRKKLIYHPEIYDVEALSLKSATKIIAGTHLRRFNAPKVNDNVLLIPEPTNPVDPKAVTVYNINLEQMGYVSAKNGLSTYIFELLKGAPKYARIKLIDTSETNPVYFLDLSSIHPFLT